MSNNDTQGKVGPGGEVVSSTAPVAPPVKKKKAKKVSRKSQGKPR